MPAVDDLKGCLFLADRGYDSLDFIFKLDEAFGYYVLRAKGLKRALVYWAAQADGKRLVDMDIVINGKLVRLFAVLSPKEKRHTYWVTNLNRQESRIQRTGSDSYLSHEVAGRIIIQRV